MGWHPVLWRAESVYSDVQPKPDTGSVKICAVITAAVNLTLLFLCHFSAGMKPLRSKTLGFILQNNMAIALTASY